MDTRLPRSRRPHFRDPGPERGPNAPVASREPAPPPGPELAAHRLYAHLAWTTLDRLPLLSPVRASQAEGHLIVLCRRLDVEPLQVRAREDRIDLLIRLKPVHSVAAVAGRLKRGSVELLSTNTAAVRWARGYAAATVAPGDVRGWIRRFASPRSRREPPGRGG